MLNEIPGVLCPQPEGAFYCYPSVKGLLGREFGGRRADSSAELAELILDEAEVAVVPGEAFGTPGYLRLSYALGDDDLEEGVSRIAKLLAEAGRLRATRMPRRPLRRAPQGAPAPAPHRLDAALHADRARRAARRGPAGRAHRPTGRRSCRGDGRARLVPVPAALRHRPLGAADRRRTCAGCCGRPPRTRRAEGSGWLEIQVDPSGYAARFGGITAFIDWCSMPRARRPRRPGSASA